MCAEEFSHVFAVNITSYAGDKRHTPALSMINGCQSMIDFIDTVVAMTEETDQTKLTELVSQMDEQLRTAVNDMAEGASLLDEASN